MRIGIDARPFIYKERSGVQTAVLEVIKRWLFDFRDNEYFLISDKEIVFPETLPGNWHKVIIPSISRKGILWQIFRLPMIIDSLKLDAYWGTNNILPRNVKGCKYLLTVHDLAFEVMPKVVSIRNLIWLKMLCKKSCQRADVIHAVSRSTKEDIIKRYNVSPEKVSAVYWGAPEGTEKKQSNELGYDYFLFLGTIEPRKNVSTILKAYSKFAESSKKDIHLIIAGKWGWKSDDVKAMLSSMDGLSSVHYFDYVDENRKSMLLDNAIALMYPSLYEGFGLPILEAYAHELVVITSNYSAMREIGKDGALYVNNPKNVDEMVALMNAVVNMSDYERNELIKTGHEVQRLYSWNECASDLLALIRV